MLRHNAHVIIVLLYEQQLFVRYLQCPERVGGETGTRIFAAGTQSGFVQGDPCSPNPINACSRSARRRWVPPVLGAVSVLAGL